MRLITNQVMVTLFRLRLKVEKVEFIGVKIEIIKVLNFTQVMEMNLGLKEIEAEVECIGVKVSLLTELPSLNNST